MDKFKNIKSEFEKLPLKNVYFFSLFFSAIIFIISLVSQFILPPQIPLYFGLPQTSDQLASSFMIIVPSLSSILIIIINILIAINLNDNYIKKTLAFGSISVFILSAITTIKIILLVSLI